MKAVMLSVAVLVTAAAGYVMVQLLRPVAPMALVVSGTRLRVLPGVPPHPDWPGHAEAVVGLPQVGALGTHGGSQPRAIASLAKIMTAYIVLRDHPLPAAEQGPQVTVRPADVAAYARDKKQGQSVVKVVVGKG